MSITIAAWRNLAIFIFDTCNIHSAMAFFHGQSILCRRGSEDPHRHQRKFYNIVHAMFYNVLQGMSMAIIMGVKRKRRTKHFDAKKIILQLSSLVRMLSLLIFRIYW